jgi:hypothetical protein
MNGILNLHAAPFTQYFRQRPNIPLRKKNDFVLFYFFKKGEVLECYYIEKLEG